MKQETAGFFVAGGTLRYDAPSYVERLADRQLRDFASAGQLCYVLTTRQMGKSSLMVRTAAYLQEHNIYTAIVDLTSIGRAPIEGWFLSVLDDLQSQLPLVTDAEEWWQGNHHLSQVKRFTKFIQEVVPREVDGRVAIFIDEIDSMLNLEFADDFFAAIRAIYNRGASLPTDQNISFVLLGVAAPNDLIKDSTRTPFNIGRQIRLEELAIEEAQVLLRGLPGKSQAILERIFFWTNGHPYLTQKLGLAIADEGERHWTDSAIDELVERLFLTDVAFNQESNLQFVRSRVISSPNKKELVTQYRQVYDGHKIRSNEQSSFQNELKLYGLIHTGDQGYLAIRNHIYRHVFNREWIRENKPPNRWRFFAVATAAITLLVIVSGIFFLRQEQQTPQPDDVLAQSYIEEFEDTANPTLRLDNLAQLLGLGGYDVEALQLFNSLTIDEQIALFEDVRAPTAATPSTPISTTLLPQIRAVVDGTYSTLYAIDLQHPQDSTRLLEAMAEALKEADDRESQALRNEIDIWLEGRRYAREGNYVSAKTAYDIAIRFDADNSATYLERALAALLLDDYGLAVADLEIVWEARPEWRGLILQEINNDDRLRDYLFSVEDPPPFISMVPKPTASPTTTTAPQPEDDPTSISASSPTPTAEITKLTMTPTPVQNPQRIVLGHSIEDKPIEAVRFGDGDNVVVFIGGLRAGYAPGTVDLAQRAVLYFSENLEAIPDSVTLYIVTNANPDSSYDPGNLAGRLNANGVDLNRNWDCRWQEDPRIGQEIIGGGGGSEPFSEPETRTLRDFFLEQRPQAVVFWLAQAASGMVVAGGCHLDSYISDQLSEVYGGASRYQFYAEDEVDFVAGDATNWLTDQEIAAVAVLLPEYERTDWNNNLLGMLTVLEHYQ